MRIRPKALCLVVLGVLLAGPVWAQQSIVEKYRNLYPTPPGGANLVAALKATAAELNRAGIRYGVLLKSGGERCLEPDTGKAYACDILCTASEQFDVFEAADGGNGAAMARWNQVPPEKVNWQGGCEFVAPAAPPPVVIPPPATPSCDLSPLYLQLSQLQVTCAAIRAGQDDHAEKFAEHAKSLEEHRADVKGFWSKYWPQVVTGAITGVIGAVTAYKTKKDTAPATVPQ